MGKAKAKYPKLPSLILLSETQRRRKKERCCEKERQNKQKTLPGRRTIPHHHPEPQIKKIKTKKIKTRKKFRQKTSEKSVQKISFHFFFSVKK